MALLDFFLNYWISITSGLLVGLISRRPLLSYSSKFELRFKKEQTHTEIHHHYYNGPTQTKTASKPQTVNDPVMDIIFWIIIGAFVIFMFSQYRKEIIIWGWRIEFFVLSATVTANITQFIRREHSYQGLILFATAIFSIIIFYKFTNPSVTQSYITYLNEVAVGGFSLSSAWNQVAISQIVGLLILLMQITLLLIQSIAYMSLPWLDFIPRLSRKFYPTKLLGSGAWVLQATLLLFSYLLMSGYASQFINPLNLH